MVIFTEVADYLQTWQDWRKKRQHFQRGKVVFMQTKSETMRATSTNLELTVSVKSARSD